MVHVRSSSTAGDSEWSTLATLRTAVLILHDLFSQSLDLDDSGGDQLFSFLAVSPGGVVPIQVFGADIQNMRNLSVRMAYDSTQVVFGVFDVADSLPSAHTLVKRDSAFVEIGIASLGGSASVNAGLVGTVRFRTTDAFSETEIRLAGAILVRGEPLEAMTRSVSVALQAAARPSPDFDGSGMVAFADFVIFATSFGKSVNLAPVFALGSPVIRSVAENAPAGAPIGDPVTATDVDGNTVTYSLWGADAEHFAIDAGTGQLLTKGTILRKRAAMRRSCAPATDRAGVPALW